MAPRNCAALSGWCWSIWDARRYRHGSQVVWLAIEIGEDSASQSLGVAFSAVGAVSAGAQSLAQSHPPFGAAQRTSTARARRGRDGDTIKDAMKGAPGLSMTVTPRLGFRERADDNGRGYGLRPVMRKKAACSCGFLCRQAAIGWHRYALDPVPRRYQSSTAGISSTVTALEDATSTARLSLWICGRQRRAGGREVLSAGRRPQIHRLNNSTKHPNE
jgi:hypothetical protein